MSRTSIRALLFLAGAFASAVGSAGVGTWTATPNSGAQTIVVGPDGSVDTDWNGQFSLQLARSSDHGASWQSFQGPGRADFAPHVQTLVLAVDPAGGLYAAFNTSANANLLAQLYLSSDGGSWTLLSSEANQYLDLAVDPFASGTLFLHGGLSGAFPSGPLVNGRLRRSTDGGGHWVQIDQPLIVGIGVLRSVTSFSLDARTPGRVYAATATDAINPGPAAPALWVSTDSGSAWAPLAANLPGIFNTLVVDPFQPSRIYGGGPAGIFRSDDGGLTFVSQSVVPTRQIVADPLHEGWLYTATLTNGVLATSDGGATWNPLNSGLADLAINELALDAFGGYLYAATSTAVFVYQAPAPGTLVLSAAHPFGITLTATDQRTGRTGSGVATQVNDLWGYFSIPAITSNPNNPEVFVKMLDGTALNGSFWFFYGGLTDLEYTLTVTEVATGRQRTYTKPAGSECGGSDTAAFAP